jgi:hypothetical protein
MCAPREVLHDLRERAYSKNDRAPPARESTKPVPGFRSIAKAAVASQKLLRGRVRRQLSSGLSERGLPLPVEKTAELWTVLLDLHVQGSRPGRAVALLDARHMMSEQVFRVTECLSGAGSSADTPRALHDVELRAIGAWLEQQQSSTPMSAVELRATEELM